MSSLYKGCNKLCSTWVYVLLMVILSSTIVCGQRNIEERAGWSLKDRLYFGGGFNINWDANYFQVGISPIVGYMLTPKLSVGTQLTWQHASFHIVKKSINQYGASIFAQHSIIDGLFAYGEFGFINTPTNISDKNRVSFLRLPLGLGYSVPIGRQRRGAINMTALYDVLFRRSNRVTSSPWIFRIYFTY